MDKSRLPLPPHSKVINNPSTTLLTRVNDHQHFLISTRILTTGSVAGQRSGNGSEIINEMILNVKKLARLESQVSTRTISISGYDSFRSHSVIHSGSQKILARGLESVQMESNHCITVHCIKYYVKCKEANI